MHQLADLITPDATERPDGAPTVMRATVLDVDETGRLTVQVPALDAGTHAIAAFGWFPYAQPGDQARVILDETNRVVIVGWEPQGEVTLELSLIGVLGG